MKQESGEGEEQQSQVCLDANAACDVCGAFGAFHFGERTLCQNCYEGCGSCCPEFGKDDLWQFADGD